MQRGLLGIQRRFRVGSLLGGGLGFSAGLFKRGGLGVQFCQYGAVFGAHLPQHRVKGQHLVQAFCLCQQPQRPAAVQPLHGPQLFLAQGKPRVIFSLLGSQRRAGGFCGSPANIQFGLGGLHGGSHVSDLPRQFRRLPGEHGNLVLGLRLGAF